VKYVGARGRGGEQRGECRNDADSHGAHGFLSVGCAQHAADAAALHVAAHSYVSLQRRLRAPDAAISRGRQSLETMISSPARTAATKSPAPAAATTA
jgi:hypothetical protein